VLLTMERDGGTDAPTSKPLMAVENTARS
jgi:hypothetical protein